jgi:hypothetical protein
MVFLLWTLTELRDGNYARMYVPLVLLALTRLVTPPLAVAAVAHYVFRRLSSREPTLRETALLAGYALVALVGVDLWSQLATLWDGSKSINRARAMVSANGLGWFDILWSVEPWTVLVPVILAAWFVRLAVTERTRLGPELMAWAATYPVFVLAVTPPTPGFLRYFMLAFPLGVGAVASSASEPRRRALGLVAVCILLLALQYAWVRYSFVLDPDPGRPVLNP